MKHTIFKFLVPIIIVAVAFGVYTYINRIDRNLLTGEIILCLRLDNPQVSGICTIKPSSNEIQEYVDGGFPFFNGNGDKFLLVRNRKIFEYDINTKTENEVFEGNEQIIMKPKYVPHKDQISFLGDGIFTIYDMKTKVIQQYTDIVISNYAWLNDGESILIDSSYIDPIYKFDLKTKTKELFIENGIKPVFSKNYDFIAFQKRGRWLTVKSLVTGQEWTSDFKNINSYCLSPSGDYVVYERDSSKYMFVEAKELIIWDYKSNKKERLIKQKYLPSVGQLDWK